MKVIKAEYSNKFMQLIEPFQLQMRTLYFLIRNTRSIININQKLEVSGNIFNCNADAIVSKILIHRTSGLSNIGESHQVRCNGILPLTCCSMNDLISKSTQ